MLQPAFNDEEKYIIKYLGSPERIAEYMHKELAYDRQDDNPEHLLTNRSFRRIVRDKKAHCLEGVFFSAAIMREHGYIPYMVCLDAFPDVSHNIMVYRDKNNRNVGSLSLSRDPALWERRPAYRNLHGLILSYYHVYTEYAGNLDGIGKADCHDVFITLRGYSHIINLDLYLPAGVDWLTGEQNVDEIEEDLYRWTYKRILPDRKDARKRQYYTSPDGCSMIPAKKSKDKLFDMP